MPARHRSPDLLQLENGAPELRRRRRLADGIETTGQPFEIARARRLSGHRADAIDLHRCAAGPDRDESLEHRVAGDRRGGFLNMVTEIRAELRRMLDRGDSLRIECSVGSGTGPGKSDPQLRARLCCSALPILRRGGSAVGIARLGPCSHVEHRRGIADTPADDVLGNQAAHDITKQRSERIACASRLEADEAIATGGDADRPAAIVGMGDRHHPACDRST
jgi:hypothetical protein